MKIEFINKETSKLKQEIDFLNLSKSERVVVFLNMVKQFSELPTKNPKDRSKNLIIDFSKK